MNHKWQRLKHFFFAKWKKIRQWLSSNLPKFPFLGHLITCSIGDYWTAAVEYLHNLAWSTMPFWLGAGLLFVQAKTGDTSLLEAFVSTFRNGELLVYTISMLTPITFYTLFEGAKGRFPHRLGIGTLSFFLIIGCACLFSLQKAQVETKPGYIFVGSLGFAAIALVLRYIAVLYNNTRVPFPNENDFTKSTDDLINEFDYALDQQNVYDQEESSGKQDASSIEAALKMASDPSTQQHAKEGD